MPLAAAPPAPGAEVVIAEGASAAWEDTLCQQAMIREVPYTVHADAFWDEAPASRELAIRTFPSEPLWSVDGRLLGTLCSVGRRRVEFDDDTQRIAQVFARLIAYQIERDEHLHRSPALLDVDTLADPLTGLPNRRALLDEVSQALADVGAPDSRHRVCVAFVDVDDMRGINRDHGRDIGDRLLVHVAQRLRRVIREGEFIARHDDDEFVVVVRLECTDVHSRELRIRHRLASAAGGTYFVNNRKLAGCGVSVGTAVAHPGEGAVSLLRRASLSMLAGRHARQLDGPADSGPAPAAD